MHHGLFARGCWVDRKPGMGHDFCRLWCIWPACRDRTVISFIYFLVEDVKTRTTTETGKAHHWDPPNCDWNTLLVSVFVSPHFTQNITQSHLQVLFLLGEVNFIVTSVRCSMAKLQFWHLNSCFSAKCATTWISQLYLGLLQLFLLMIFQMSHSDVESPCIHVVSTAYLSEGLRGSSPGRRAQTSLMGGHMMVGVSLPYYCRVYITT